MIQDKETLKRLAKAYAKLDEEIRKQNRSAGEISRDKAMARVDAAADPVWKKLALEAVVYVCERRATLTTDAVWHFLDYAGVPRPREPKAMGPIMTRAAKIGICVATNQFEPTVREPRHRAPLRVWRSKSYDRALDVDDFPH